MSVELHFTFWLHVDDMVYKSSEKVDQSKMTISFKPIIEDTQSYPALQDYTEKQIVLLVEDNSDMRRFVTSLLDENYAVFEAVNGIEGFEKAKEVVPDLIISDVMMPEMDGYEFCTLIKNDYLTSHIPVILLTAKAAPENKIEGLETGADDYILKPFNKIELLIRIKNLISTRKKLRDKISNEISSGVKPDNSTEKGLSKVDKQFIDKIIRTVENNYPDPDFDIEHFCSLVGMSQTQLRRKMSALFAKSPVEFIRSYRLNKAAKLMNEEGQSVSEAAYATGFNNLSYFTKCFRQEFGKLPSELAVPNKKFKHLLIFAVLC